MTILIPQLSGRASTMGDLSFISGQRCYTVIYEGRVCILSVFEGWFRNMKIVIIKIR